MRSLTLVLPSLLVLVVVGCANSDGTGLVSIKRTDAGHDGLVLDPEGGLPSTDSGSGLHPPTDSGSGTPAHDSGSSGFDTGTPPPFDSGTGGGFDTGTSGGPVDTGTGGPPPGGSDSTCGAMSTYNDCASCCATNHPDGYDGFITALATCACTPSVCQSQCGSTFCASSPSAPDATCTTCLNDAQAGACNSAISSACGPGGPCAPYADCVTAQCSSLP